MKLLIGNTGLVGSTLKESIKFDYEFNSKNLQDLLAIEHSNLDLYLCCLPATKWMINKEPLKDFNNMLSILNLIKSKKYNNIILYSTIDIYQNEIVGSNENTTPPITQLNYGSTRLLFEYFAKDILSYNNLKIIRLPALYGKHIKKNVLYDLLNKNNIANIPWNSKFQWYNLDKLATDTNSILNLENSSKVHITNLFTEPIETSVIVHLFGLSEEDVDSATIGASYSCQTVHHDSGFTETKDKTLDQIKKFIKIYKK
jgi:hypothetical protein